MRALACFGSVLVLFLIEAILGAGSRGLGPFFAWDALLIVVGATALIVLARFSLSELRAGANGNGGLLAVQCEFAAKTVLRVGALSSLLYIIVALEFADPALLVRRLGIGLTGVFFGGALSLFLNTVAETITRTATTTSRGEIARRPTGYAAPSGK